MRLPRFNRWLRDCGLGDGFGMGIGLNSGPFISGNVGSARLGSARRLEYAVHGDTVDTASRLEGMTKDLGRSTLMSDATCWALAHRPDGLDFVGESDVRGRRSAISPRLRFALIDAPRRFAAVSGRSPRAGVRRATAAAPTPRMGCPARSS